MYADQLKSNSSNVLMEIISTAWFIATEHLFLCFASIGGTFLFQLQLVKEIVNLKLRPDSISKGFYTDSKESFSVFIYIFLVRLVQKIYHTI